MIDLNKFTIIIVACSPMNLDSYQSLSLCTDLSIYLSLFLPFFLSMSLCIYLSHYFAIYISINPSIYWFYFLLIILSVAVQSVSNLISQDIANIRKRKEKRLSLLSQFKSPTVVHEGTEYVVVQAQPVPPPPSLSPSLWCFQISKPYFSLDFANFCKYFPYISAFDFLPSVFFFLRNISKA